MSDEPLADVGTCTKCGRVDWITAFEAGQHRCPSAPVWMPPLYCTTCGCTSTECLCMPGARNLQPLPKRQRSVVGTTLLVLLTVFVIAPILLIGGCNVLAGMGG